VADQQADSFSRRIEANEAAVWARCIDEVGRASESSSSLSPLTARAVDIGGATAFALEGLDSFDVNRALGLGFAGDPRPGAIDEIVSAYRAFGLRRYQLEVLEEPSSRCESLFEAAGLGRHRDPIWTVWRGVDASAMPERDVPVRTLGPSDGDALAKLQRIAWGIWEPDQSHDLWFTAPLGKEGFTYFGAFLDDELVAAGALFVAADADPTMAWAGFDATHPRLRRQRLRHELGVARQWRAAELGCEVIHGDMYLEPKQRTWRLAYRKTRWVPSGSEGTSPVA